MIAQYRSSGICITETEDNIVVVEQTKLDDKHWMMTQRELIKRGRTVYPEKRYKIVPVTYSLDLSTITPEWIQEQMQEYDIRPKDLTRQLGLNASEVSLLLSGKRNMTRSIRSMFYYYFLSYRLSKDMRKPPITTEELTRAIDIVRSGRDNDKE